MQNLRLLLLTIVAVTLFSGGVFLLLSHVAFWSLFLGIPATQTGIIFLILAFEELTKDTFDDEGRSILQLKPPKLSH